MSTNENLTETCSCGASVTFSGHFTSVKLRQKAFHDQHKACAPIPPGPCWHDSGFAGPTGAVFRCDLLAGHAGAHQADRGSRVGTAVWGDDEATA